MPWPMLKTPPGRPSYFDSSWFQITCSMADAPRPPYSFGQVMQAQPASYLRFCQSLACLDVVEPASSFRVGTFFSSQARASVTERCFLGCR
jgi:hypothetical protein